ncbi:hypothetical protein AN1V17_11570 [Vallitalea sediminicola]
MSTFFNPVKLTDEQEYKFILAWTKSNIEKEIIKVKKLVEKASEKARNMDINNSTKKQRVNARLRLESVCEERDRWERRLDIVNKIIAGKY